MVKKKKCNKCNITKLVSEFYLRKRKKLVKSKNIIKTYIFPASICKNCQKKEFKKLKPKSLNEDGSPNWTGVLYQLKKRSKEKEINYDLSTEKFLTWFKRQKKTCRYCKFNLKDSKKAMIQLLKERSFFSASKFNIESPRFTIDRKDNFYGYSFDNICLACHYCNSMKSDKYSYKDFIKYAKKNIIPRFKKILRELNKKTLKIKT